MSDDESTTELDDGGIVEMVEKARKEGDSQHAEWRAEAEICYDFVAGHQWTEQEESALKEKKRIPVVMNRVGAVVSAIRGQEVNNRTRARYVARRLGVAMTDEMMTAAADYVRDMCNAEFEEAEAIADMIITGVGVTETCMDYEESEDGNCQVDHRDPLSVRWDPAARKKNLRDRRWEQTDEWLTHEQIEARWPDADIEALTIDEPDAQTAPHDATNAWKYETNAQGYDRRTGRYRVTRHVYIELETYHRVLDPQSGQVVAMPEDRFETLAEAAKANGKQLQSVRGTKRVIRQAYVVGKQLLEHSLAPSQRDFPLQFMTCYRDRNQKMWYGVVRSMLDPQRLSNTFFSLMIHILATNAKGGMMAEEGAIPNISKFDADWAAPDSTVIVRKGALSGGSIQPKPRGEYPVQLDSLLQFSVTSIRDVVGANLELLGQNDKAQAGVLEEERVKAALTILAPIFDSISAYRRQHGRLLADFIQQYMSDGRLIKVVGKEGEQYVQLFRNPEVVEYDLVVDEASNARNVKDRTFRVLMALLPHLVPAGIPIPQEAIDYLPVPEGLRQSWKAQIAQRAQQGGQKPSPEQIKVEGAIALQDKKHAHKLEEIQAGTQADLVREQAQAESEKNIEMTRAQAKIAERQSDAHATMTADQHYSALETRLKTLEALLKDKLDANSHARTMREMKARPAKPVTTPAN